MIAQSRERVAVSFIRWSHPSQASGDSLRRQTAMSEAYAKAHGLRLLPVSFREEGTSAFRGQQRREGSALHALVSAVRSRKIPRDAWVLVEQVDRLSREDVLTALDAFRALLSEGLTIVTLTDQRIYTAASLKENFTDLLLFLTIAARANEESVSKSRRLGAAWSNKRKLAVESKRPLTARCPSWLTLKDGAYVVHKDRARTVHMIFEWTAAGQGKSQVTRRLHREGIKPIGRVGSWHPSYVEKLLRSRAVLGEYQPHRLVVDPATGQKRRVPEGDPIVGMWPAIVSPALFLKVQRGRQERRLPSGPRGSGVSSLFSGLVRCACGSPAYLVNKGRDRRTAVLSKWLDCRDRLRGMRSKRPHSQPWPYPPTERLLLSLLSRVIPWGKLLPQTRSAAQDQLDALVEREAAVAVERESVALKLARVSDAIEAGGKLDTLIDRMRALEASKLTLDKEAENIREKLGSARATLASARETVDRQKKALAAWEQGKMQSEDDRTRLAATLRELLEVVELRKDRRLGITLTTGESYDFVCSDDLLTVEDVDGGDVVVKLN